MSKDGIRERLVGLGPERLAEALLELAAHSNEADNVVNRLTATPNENIERFKMKLAGLKRANRFIDWRGAADFARELEQMLADLEAGCDDPEIGTDLMIAFFEADQYVFEQCDDSSGCIGDVFSCSACDLFVRYASGYSDRARLLDKLVELCRVNDYGVRDTLLDAAHKFLPKDALRQLTDGLPQARRRKTAF